MFIKIKGHYREERINLDKVISYHLHKLDNDPACAYHYQVTFVVEGNQYYSMPFEAQKEAKLFLEKLDGLLLKAV